LQAKKITLQLDYVRELSIIYTSILIRIFIILFFSLYTFLLIFNNIFFNYKQNNKTNIFNHTNMNTIMLPVLSLKIGKENIDFVIYITMTDI